MRITLSGRAAALDAESRQEITDAGTLQKLDGLLFTELSCCDYHDDPALEKLNLAGGHVGLAYAADRNQLRVVTRFQAARELKRKELELLSKETTAQWSDGIGEADWWQSAVPGIALDLSPSSHYDKDLQIEQFDDGIKPPRKKYSPLLKAAEAGDLAKIRELLAKGEDINARDKNGAPVLQLALRGPEDPTTGKRHGASVEAILFLIEQGADVKSGYDLKLGYSKPVTALHTASAVPSPLPVLEAMLAKGADVNARNGDQGWSPLFYAIAGGHLEAAKFLLAHGAGVNQTDLSDRTPIMYLYDNHLETAQLLLEHGADINIRNFQGETACEAALNHAGRIEGTNLYANRNSPFYVERQKPFYAVADLLVATLRERAAAGDGLSQHCLAHLQQHGRVVGIPKDEKEAFLGFERAAQRGCRLALARIGRCYQEGKGVGVDLVKAADYFRRGAEAGVPNAMGLLADCYAKGEGVAKNESEAAAWARKGAEIDPAAAASPAELFDFRKDTASCRVFLAECYDEGFGVAKDLNEALRWFKAAKELRYNVDEQIKRIEKLLAAR